MATTEVPDTAVVPATDELIASLRDTAAEYRRGFPGTGHENLWGLNLTSYMGERMSFVIARVDALVEENKLLRRVEREARLVAERLACDHMPRLGVAYDPECARCEWMAELRIALARAEHD